MDKRTRNWFLAIIITATVVRVGIALYLGNHIDAPSLLTDQRSYHALGLRLVAGHGYSFATGWYPFTRPGTPTAFWSFLYSAFVAAVYAVFGANPLAVRLVQAVLGGVLLPWMVYRLARRSFPGRTAVAVVAAGLAAGYGYFVLYAATLMTETFFIVLLLWSLEISMSIGQHLRSGETVSVRDRLLFGMSLGLATLIRQSILPWLPVLFLWLLWQARQGHSLCKTVRALVPSGLVVLALILPWTYRNYRVYGQFLLLNSNTGYAMYAAQHPMHGTQFSEFATAPLPEGILAEYGGNEAQMDRELMQRGLQFVLDDPGRYLLLSLSRVRAYFEFWPTPDTTLLHNIGRSGSFGLCLPFVLYGLVFTLRERALWQGNELLLIFLGFYSMLHILTWAMVRYRLPVDAIFLLFAALALQDLYVRGRSWLAQQGSPGNTRAPAGH